MPSGGRQNWQAIIAPFQKMLGVRLGGQLGYDNGITGIRRAKDNTGSMVDLQGVSELNQHLLAAAHYRPLRMPITFTLATNASLTSQRFFIADQNYEITSITCSYATADGAANTGFITKEVSGQAPGAGVSVMTNTFNLNTTTNTPQAATLGSRLNPGFFGTGEPPISIKQGEMLSFKFASGVTSLAGLQVTLLLQPQSCYNPATFVMNLNGDIATQVFFQSNRYLNVAGVQVVVSTVASGAPTITLDITKDTGTNAPGAGTSILSAAVNVSNTAVANAPVSPALSATASVLKLNPGDRLAVKTSGTLTALAGVVIVVSFNQVGSLSYSTPMGEVFAQYNLFKAANLGVDSAFFNAGTRDWLLTDVSGIWSVAGGTGARATVTVDTGTTAPGAGVSVLTDNTNAGFDLTTTANTTGVGTLSVSRRKLLVPAGARLSVHYAGTVTPLAGLVVNCSLQPA